jgi:hypothetical protein
VRERGVQGDPSFEQYAGQRLFAGACALVRVQPNFGQLLPGQDSHRTNHAAVVEKCIAFDDVHDRLLGAIGHGDDALERKPGELRDPTRAMFSVQPVSVGLIVSA